ncbi:hypothetical protein [Gemmobacter sp.]|uniref:hypothetical protein n=1 Tax=Gemmobacter sp. TaxID=1898957 RepID=UPI002AFEC316|nr:hypothetical protein [Gemmobacter sp.]
MSGDLIKVRITAPVKLGPRWLRPGDEPEVTADDRAQLEAAGAVERDPDATQVVLTGTPVRAFTQSEFETATAVTAQMLAEAMLDAALEEVTTQLRAEKAALLARAVEAEAQRDMLQDRVLELQDQLSAATAAAGQAVAADGQHPTTGGAAAPDQPDTPEPSETAAKTTPKKGAAAKPKG